MGSEVQASQEEQGSKEQSKWLPGECKVWAKVERVKEQ